MSTGSSFASSHTSTMHTISRSCICAQNLTSTPCLRISSRLDANMSSWRWETSRVNRTRPLVWGCSGSDGRRKAF
jgi:hypothetical protein